MTRDPSEVVPESVLNVVNVVPGQHLSATSNKREETLSFRKLFVCTRASGEDRRYAIGVPTNCSATHPTHAAQSGHAAGHPP